MNLPDGVTRFRLDPGAKAREHEDGEMVWFTDHKAALGAAYRKGREDALTEAREAVEAERLTDDTGDAGDEAYNRAIVDVDDALASLAGEKEKDCPDRAALTADARDALAGLVRAKDFDEMKLRGVLALLDLANGTGKERTDG